METKPQRRGRQNDILIRTLKGGVDRIVRIQLIDNKLILDVCKSELIFGDYDRFFIYRYCKKHGLQLRKDGLTLYSVTHSFRTAYAHSILEISDQNRTTANAMGHRRTKTIEYYDKKIIK